MLSRFIARQEFENEDFVIAIVSLEVDINQIPQTVIQVAPLSTRDTKCTN